jgi:pimeloyl-ACP methyl ester carboxylesterase
VRVENETQMVSPGTTPFEDLKHELDQICDQINSLNATQFANPEDVGREFQQAFLALTSWKDRATKRVESELSQDGADELQRAGDLHVVTLGDFATLALEARRHQGVLSELAARKSAEPPPTPEKKSIGKVPRLAATWVQYLLGFGVSIAVGLAPYLGKVHVPLFEPMLSLIPLSLQDIAIPVSSAAMGMVAVAVQWFGAERLSTIWLRAKFRQAVFLCVLTLAALTAIEILAVVRVDVPAVHDHVSFATGFSYPNDPPCEGLGREACIHKLSLDESKINPFFGELGVNLTKLLLVLTYTVFMSTFGCLVGLAVLKGRLDAAPMLERAEELAAPVPVTGLFSPQETESLVVIDQTSTSPRGQSHSDRLQPEVGASGFLKVSWNAVQCPPGYTALGNGVVFVDRPPGYNRRQYDVRLDNHGESSYGWQDTIFGHGLVLVVMLPPNCVLRTPDDAHPIPSVSKVFNNRFAFFWTLKGEPGTQVHVRWQIQTVQETEIPTYVSELNKELAQRGPVPAHIIQSEGTQTGGRLLTPSALEKKLRSVRWLGWAAAITALLGVGGIFVLRSSGKTHKPNPSAISHYERNDHNDRVIVFVHGIFGDALDTWRCPSTRMYWPSKILTEDAFKGFDVYVASYESPYFGNGMTIDEIVSNLQNRLQHDGVFDHKQVIFVAHSLGGLIVQRFLLTHREHAKQVPFIYFYSTPETGAEIARLGSLFSSDPLLKEMFSGDANDYLLNLESEWKAAGFTNIHRYCAYEKLPMKGVMIVDRLSGTRNCETAVAINQDHAGIVKPCSTDADSYIALLNAVSTLTAESPSPPYLATIVKGTPLEKCRSDAKEQPFRDLRGVGSLCNSRKQEAMCSLPSAISIAYR